MEIKRFLTIDDLSVLAAEWDRLAGGVPFRTHQWLTGWWRHYSPALTDARLFVLAISDGGVLRAIAPWYSERRRPLGRVIRFLGTGEICSDYLGVLCQPGYEEEVAGALSMWLLDVHPSRTRDAVDRRWDLLELTDVDPASKTTQRLAGLLAAEGCPVDQRTGPNCWRLTLPDDWETYVSQLSKSHRKQVRRLERDLNDSGKAVLHTVTEASELEPGWNILIDLHQRRRRSLNEPGCFASPAFASFHRELAESFLNAGRLKLHWLEWEGRPVAAEYHLAGDDAVYAYQAGIDPDSLEIEPGRLISVAIIRRAIAERRQAIDFLRGDEPYKAHWRAEPRPSLEYRIASRAFTSRCRQGVWLAGDRLKQWVKTGLGRDLRAET